MIMIIKKLLGLHNSRRLFDKGQIFLEDPNLPCLVGIYRGFRFPFCGKSLGLALHANKEVFPLMDFLESYSESI